MHLKTLTVSIVLVAIATTTQAFDSWVIPAGGNTFRIEPSPGGRGVTRENLRLENSSEAYRVYFSIDRAATVTVALQGTGDDVDVAAVFDEKSHRVRLKRAASVHELGTFKLTHPGYWSVDLALAEGNDGKMAQIESVQIDSDTEGLEVDFVRNNDGNMFYWGRRGPSVHLGYDVPKGIDLAYAYSEIKVPEGKDPVGTYFMANGFGQGYFGFQVNSETERRVLFSVWSPFQTNNPAEIPEEDRVQTLAKGQDVWAQDFGNEGSGGQSFLRYPWKAGVVYRFLTKVQPDGTGNTVYTSWFGDKQANEWRLIASFRRPKTDTYLTGFHSFLEGFNPAWGHHQRLAHYQNQWVCDVHGQWHEITQSRFTGDGTARGKHRLDFAGGSDGDHFFLQNCGFFDERVKLDQQFTRESTSEQKPIIDLEKLNRMTK